MQTTLHPSVLLSFPQFEQIGLVSATTSITVPVTAVTNADTPSTAAAVPPLAAIRAPAPKTPLVIPKDDDVI